MKIDFLPPELSKTGQITPVAVLKNHSKSHKVCGRPTEVVLLFGKSLLHPNLWGLEHITPQPMKMEFLPPELSKTGQITP
jgi:hypothetical protein